MAADRHRALHDPRGRSRTSASFAWRGRTELRWQDCCSSARRCSSRCRAAALVGILSRWHRRVRRRSRSSACFFFTNVWNPVKRIFGGLAPIYGTLVTSAIALLIGVPVSFGIALFLTEMCPVVLKRPLGTAVELLAAIPSIIYGMWGLFVFAPLFGDYVSRC